MTDLVRADITETFQGLSWTRVVSLQEVREQDEQVWHLVFDILEAREAIALLERPDQPLHQIMFDPKAYQDTHEALNLAGNLLSRDELQQWGKRVSQVRKGIKDKAKNINTRLDGSVIDDEGPGISAEERLEPQRRNMV